ncbi:hypothetical protein Tco_1010151 [Tanacetum coccineum]
MKILLEPTSNKLMVEIFDTSAGNPVKKILLKLNLLDHRILKDGGKDTKRNIQLAVKGSHSSLGEGTRKSQLLPKGKTTDPKDSGGNVQPIDKRLPSTVSDEGTGRTKPLPEGPHEDKDSKRLKLGITNPSCKTSSKVEPDSQTLVLTTAAEVQALFLFDDDLDKSEDDEFEHQSLTHHKEQLKSSQARDTDAYDSESSSCSETFRPYDNFVPVPKRETMKNIDKIIKAGVDKRAKLLKSLNKVSKTLEADSALKAEMKKIDESNNTTSCNITSLTKLPKNAKLLKVITKLDDFQSSSGPVIDIISPEQPKNLLVAPKADRRKGITTDDTESPKKLVKALTVVRPNPDEPFRKIRKAAKEAKLLEMSKPELIKVVQEEATKAGFDLKILASAKGKCNMILPEGVPFVNNMVIKEPEHGMFFIDVFSDEAFQRMSDINKVGVEALSVSCLQDAQPESTRKTLAFSEAVLSE